MAGPSPVTVYVPVPDRPAVATIDRGSGIVGTPMVPEDPESPILAFYEGNRYGYANVVTFADRCMIAEGRLRTNAPTVAKQLIRPDDVIAVGTYHPDERRVEVHEARGLVELARWLDLATYEEFYAPGHKGVVPTVSGFDSDELHTQMRGSGR